METGGAERSDRWGLTLPLLLVSGVVAAVAAGMARGAWLPNLHNGLLGLAFACVGAYVVHQQPRNRCGWSFLAAGVVEAVMFLGRQIGHDPGPGTSPWWGWLGAWPLVVGLGLVTLSVIVFPDGSVPSRGWRRVVWVGAVVTTGLAALSALWPVGADDAGVVTSHPFTLGGVDWAGDLWAVAARPTYVAFQILWLVAVVARWRTSGRVVRRQLTVVGAAVATSLAALAIGLVVWGTPTAGVLAVGLVPVAAGWAIVHEQTLATHSALTWLVRRSDDDDALPAELAEAIADALTAEHVVVWARRDDHVHAVGVWPEPDETIVPIGDVALPGIAAGGPNDAVRAITRKGVELGAVVVERSRPLSRHDERLLDGFCGQARLVLEHLAAPPALTNGTSTQLYALTPRELEVLHLMSKGLTNAAICEHLHLSIKTVEPAVSSVFTKLGLPPGRESNRRVLAVLAYIDHQRPNTPER